MGEDGCWNDWTEATKAACDHINSASTECVSSLFGLMLRCLKDQDLRICATRNGIVEVRCQPCPPPQTSPVINLDTDPSSGLVPMSSLPYRTCIHPPSCGYRTRRVEHSSPILIARTGYTCTALALLETGIARESGRNFVSEGLGQCTALSVCWYGRRCTVFLGSGSCLSSLFVFKAGWAFCQHATRFSLANAHYFFHSGGRWHHWWYTCSLRTSTCGAQ